MTHFDCLVDTRPMAHEIESVSKHIKGTTAAVVGMRAAVLKAEDEAATHVCNNVNKGFYTLIHSQISQKIARLQSDVDSHIMKLNQLRKQLLAIKGRMERDYGMITSRYSKLFNGLNKNLHQRVFELDKPVMNFATRDTNALNNRTRQLPATFPLAQLESLAVSQRIIASNMKNRGCMALDSMNRFLLQMKEQELLTERILLPRVITENISEVLLPVIITESNYDSHNHTSKNVIVHESSLTSRGREAIRKCVYETPVEWKENNAINEEICSEFHRCVSQSSASPRVKEMAQKLFDSCNFQTLKG